MITTSTATAGMFNCITNSFGVNAKHNKSPGPARRVMRLRATGAGRFERMCGAMWGKRQADLHALRRGYRQSS